MRGSAQVAGRGRGRYLIGVARRARTSELRRPRTERRLATTFEQDNGRSIGAMMRPRNARFDGDTFEAMIGFRMAMHG